MFPSAHDVQGTFSPDTAGNNAIYEGFNLRSDRLLPVNGQFDIRRSASLLSRWTPPFENTELQRTEVVGGGLGWDGEGSKTYPDVKHVTLGATKWVQDRYAALPREKNNIPPESSPGRTRTR